MSNEIEDIKVAGVLKSEQIDADVVRVTIIRQERYSFSDNYRLKNGEIVHSSDYDQRIKIASINMIEYHEEDNIIEFFLKGDMDRSQRYLKIDVPLAKWESIKKCLQASGFLVDEEPKEEGEKEKVDLGNKLGEPTDEEIDKMLELVDLKTFGTIIKNRVFAQGISKKEVVEKITDDLLKKYLRTWAVNKYRFYKMFGDKLKIEKEIDIAPDENLVRQEINEIKMQFPLYTAIFESVSTEAIGRNEIKKDYTYNSYFTDKKVKEGMKFTKFISLYGNKDLDMALSKLYQNLGKTTISISIDPVDYLTVSMNRSGWKSCHNFFDGQFRNATLSYMNDETSLVSYVAGKNVPYTDHSFTFEWNSKRWRQMIYMSKESSAIAFSRQYPNESNEISQEVRILLEDVFSNYFNVENKWKVFNQCSNGNVAVEKDEGSLVYNDIGNGYGHKLIRNINDTKYGESEYIKIGATVKTINNEYEEVRGSGDNIWW